MGARAALLLAGGSPHRASDVRRRRLTRTSAARGVRGAAARRDTLPDRLSHRCPAAGLGGRDSGSAAPVAAGHTARPAAPGARDGRAARPAGLGGVDPAVRGTRLREDMERASRRRRCHDRGSMKIAILSPVWFPVPPTGYGGIEWVVSLLADGLADAGHDVTLFASGDSHTRAKLAFVYEIAPSADIGRAQVEIHHALSCFERADEFDVINDHSGPPAAVIGGAVKTPTLHTVHGPLLGDAGELYEQVARVSPRTGLISISMNQRAPHPELPWVANIPNALDFSFYPVQPRRGDYFLFLGRMNPEKGAHRAVAVAMEAGVPLKLAGKKREPAEEVYFHEYVEPHLREGEIEYLGEVSHGEKVELLQDARATLFPVDWEEPFGLVMIESMACGTPVIATRRGAVPEVIEHGRSGIIVDDYRDMVRVLEQVDELEPLELRRAAEERFSKGRMVADYVAAFESAVASA